MRTQTLTEELRRGGLLKRLMGERADEVIIGVGRDPEDRRRNCILLYVPPDFAFKAPEFVTLDGERVRVVTRARGGDLVAYAD